LQKTKDESEDNDSDTEDESDNQDSDEADGEDSSDELLDDKNADD
jgi:hypothetical protein